jgi:predicted ATP-dependent endonuclease of OLD family
MLIKNIKLRNFRSIKNLDWEINKEKIEVLVGQNSVGKSAIIDAILCFDESISEIKKDDKPNDNFDQNTELIIKLQLTERELKELDISLSDYYSKKKKIMFTSDKQNSKTVTISKIFLSSNGYYFKINNIELTEFIFQDIQRIKKILEPHINLYNFNRYSIFQTSKPIQDPEVLNHDLSAIKSFYNQNRENIENSDNAEAISLDFVNILDIINKIETYNKRINNLLPKFKRFDYIEYGKFIDRIIYDQKVFNQEIVNHMFSAMNLDPKYLIQNRGDYHIIDQISKNRDLGLEKFLSNNWLKKEINIEMIFHPEYVVCSINDGFPSTTISQRSLGEKWLLSFLIFIYFYRRMNENLIIVIDEPSINLHPNAQKKIIKIIENITKKFPKIGFFYTTHSPYLIPKDRLDRIARVIKPQSKGSLIIKFNYNELLKRKNKRFSKSNATINTLKARLSQMFTIRLREAFFGEGVILCEGYTEILSLPIWGELLDYNLDDNAMILIRASKFEMIDYAEFFYIFKIPVFLIFDNDSDKEKEKKQHIRYNKMLIDYADGKVEEFPKGKDFKYFIFTPNYEKCLKDADSNYSIIEEEISNKFGTGGKKGIRARYVAIKYRDSNYQAPKPIISLITSIKKFQNINKEDPDRYFRPKLFLN